MVRTDKTWKDSHCGLDLEKKAGAGANVKFEHNM